MQFIKQTLPSYLADLTSIVCEYMVGEGYDEICNVKASEYISKEAYVFLYDNPRVIWSVKCAVDLIETENSKLITDLFPALHENLKRNISVYTSFMRSDQLFELSRQLDTTLDYHCIVKALHCNEMSLQNLTNMFMKLKQTSTLNFREEEDDKILDATVRSGNVQFLQVFIKEFGVKIFQAREETITQAIVQRHKQMVIFLMMNKHSSLKRVNKTKILEQIITFLPDITSSFLMMFPSAACQHSFETACLNGSVDIVKEHLSINNSFYKNIEPEFIELLCEDGNTDIIMYLFNLGVSFTPDSITAALENGHFDLGMFLYYNTTVGVDPTTSSLIATEGNIEILHWLYEQKVCPILWKDCLINSVSNSHTDIVKWILKTTPLIEKVTTPLIEQDVIDIASENGNVELVSWLIQTFKLRPSEKSFCVAASEGHIEVLKILNQNGQPVCINISPVDMCAETGDSSTIEWLLRNRPQDKVTDSALTSSVQNNDLVFVKTLVTLTSLKPKVTHIETCITQNYHHMLKFLLEVFEGDIPLNIMNKCHTKACLRTLLKSGSVTIDTLKELQQTHPLIHLKEIIETFIKHR
jgi:hypothetical protein